MTTIIECLQGRPLFSILHYIFGRSWEPHGPEFKSWGHHLLVLQLCACYITSANLSFLVRKVGIIMAPTPTVVGSIK